MKIILERIVGRRDSVWIATGTHTWQQTLGGVSRDQTSCSENCSADHSFGSAVNLLAEAYCDLDGIEWRDFLKNELASIEKWVVRQKEFLKRE